jgi:two-component system LytT family response regulator
MTVNKIRALIADDESAARRGLRLLLERDPDVTVVAEVASGSEAVKRIVADKPDLVFLDVQMPEMDGFKVLQAVNGSHAPVIIFVTAYDEHALKAFEVNAVDYLLKPFDDDRFFAALRRAKAEIQHRQTDMLGAKLGHLLNYLQSGRDIPSLGVAAEEAKGSDRILLKSGGEIFFLKADEIDWIEAEGDYMKFHAGGRTHLLRETMARLEARLDAKKFIRIHRSTIVNIDRVKKLSPSFAGEYAVILADGTKLKLSRGYHERLQELLKHAL